MQGKVGSMYMQTAALHKMPELNVPNLLMKPLACGIPELPPQHHVNMAASVQDAEKDIAATLLSQHHTVQYINEA